MRQYMATKHLVLFMQFIIYAIFALIVYHLFHQQAIGLFPSDVPVHLSIIDPYISGKYHIPHPAFHLVVYYIARLTNVSYETASSFIMTASVLVTLFIVQNLLCSKQFPARRQVVLPVALSLLMVIAIYVPFFNSYMYLGQFSPNIWHSPTMLLLKPLALLSFLFFVEFLANNENCSPYRFLAGSFFLFLSTVVKPSFVITFLPAVGLYLITFRRGETRLYGKVFLWAGPSLAILAYQYIETYQSNATQSYFHDKIIFTNFGVFKLYTPSIVISTLLVLAFPLIVAIVGHRNAIHSLFLRMTWLITLIAFLQAAFLAEEQKFEQGAFGFGYVIALFLLYVYSMREYLGWFRGKDAEVGNAGKGLVLLIYLLHLASGGYYFVSLLRGKGYF